MAPQIQQIQGWGQENDGSGDSVRVLLIAAYASVRAGLHALLADAPGLTVVGSVEGVNENLRRLLPRLRPSVLLLDTTGDSSANDSLAYLLTLRPTEPMLAEVSVVVLSDCPVRDLPRLQAARVPGFGYLSRDSDRARVVATVRAVAEGLTVVDRLPEPAPVPFGKTAEIGSPTYPGETLTARETEVLQLMAQGLPNKQIAHKLGITLHTAKFHVAQILGKLNASSRTEAVTQGARRGYVVL